MPSAIARNALRLSLAFVVSGLGVAGCAKSGSQGAPGDSPAGGDGGGGGGADGTVGTSGPSHGADDGGGPIVLSEATVGGDACQHFDVRFIPQIPLVFVLADRSGSMFQRISTADGGTTNEWDPLRNATLSVINNLDSQVAFGFGAYTGINPNTTPNMCPILPNVPIALHNSQAIANLYLSLGDPTSMFKAETPAQMSLEKVAQFLAQAATAQTGASGGLPGGQYILFVTDGETDFCDDGNPVCPADAVIAEIQKLRLSSQKIQTLILGLGSNLSNISGPVLQDFANAGAGLGTAAPPGSAAGLPLLPGDIYNQCSSVPGWHQLFTNAGLSPGQALGTYAPGTQATNAILYNPDPTNVMDLTNKIAAALKTVKSCSFDLQGKIKVDLTQAKKGQIAIDGTPLPYDATNGWTMASATQLDLVGTACQQWRATGMNVTFDFPCDIIIFLQ
ncbi:MAG: VWA domain-containing protein [Myxococcota bacterium]|nr:VWA domain-containing protein [Myxococcota bacterium]